MATDVSWIFDIEDKATKALADIEKKMGELPATADAADKAIKKLDNAMKLQKLAGIKNPLAQARGLLELHRDKMRGAEKASSSFFDSLNNGAVMGLVTGGLNLAASAAEKFASGVIDGGLALAKYALDAAESKRATLAALEVFDGPGAAGAKDILEDMGKLAGKSDDKVTALYLKLRGAGVAAAAAQDMVGAALDVSVFKGGGAAGDEAMDKFIDLMTKMDVLAKTSPKDILGLAKTVGLAPEAISENLSKRMGVSADAALEALKSGKADAVDIQESIMAVIQQRDQGDVFGSSAAKFAKGDVRGQIEATKISAKNLFEDIDFRPLAEGLERIRTTYLEGDNAEKFKAGLREIPPILENLVAKTFELASGFDEAFKGEELKKWNELFDGLDEKMGKTDMKQIGRDLGELAENVIKLARALESVVTFGGKAYDVLGRFTGLGGMIESVKLMGKSASGMAGQTRAAGADAGAGLAKGLDDTADKVGSSAGGLAQTIPDEARNTLDEHSPSKVMHEIGEFAVEGLEQPLNDAQPRIPMSTLLDSARAGAESVAGASGYQVGGGLVIHMGDINITGADTRDANELAQTIRRGVKDELYSVLEEMSLA